MGVTDLASALYSHIGKWAVSVRDSYFSTRGGD